MPLHTFDHKYNTVLKKDPAIDRWVYQRYLGQFGQFRINSYNLKWLVILYGAFPAYLYYTNEWGVSWLDGFREENINAIRMGRVSWKDMWNDWRK
ncbi:hypothetical protein MIR68_007035 [Amoeboaphelidium protococcarum]|nr:hypothetical protein MIR68_007035 [Amoeboaphelidium protococcarum]KAI3645330.1 hypothetical protein MP228_011494 [Amoeboaphelidium protococcarum]KAI3652737.1 hypothetical protein MP228_002162 [Amoeboaphelidium protococcarum]